MPLKDNVRRLRDKLGWSQEKLAKEVGVRQNTIAAIETGETKKTRYLNELANVLGARPHEVDDSLPPPNENSLPPMVEPLTTPPNILVGVRDLPVHVATEAGRGALIVSTDPVEFVLRPAPLAQVREGYGLIVIGDSMIPAYEPGDTILTHPHLQPAPNTDVVLYSENVAGEVKATVKRLIRFTATHWTLRQWNPPKRGKREFVLSRKEWPRCHRVVGKYARR